MCAWSIYRCFNTQNYIYPFQNLSLRFILKIFLKFRKFQPLYSYKILILIKRKECIPFFIWLYMCFETFCPDWLLSPAVGAYYVSYG